MHHSHDGQVPQRRNLKTKQLYRKKANKIGFFFWGGATVYCR